VNKSRNAAFVSTLISARPFARSARRIVPLVRLKLRFALIGPAMNDDAPGQLDALKAEHRRLDQEIAELELAGNADQLVIARLKKRKLHLKDQIALIADRNIPDIIA